MARKSLEELAGPTTAGYIRRTAANLLKDARIRTGLTQQQVADAAGVPRSTIARIETGRMQPSIPTLSAILIAIGLDIRMRLDLFDDHDRVLDRRAAADPDLQAEREAALDEFFSEYGFTA
ncbi:helix-turn-helix transcriptional regulator [Nocardioides nitrophenolicus]|uniref:helix-turn-helix transcriptional regulator n=1 Tax=Nocardioides nitrophenolicus TaxID=60489 RepID=UPI001956651B|nr:helix-turn-helix transcriptional regulator [Nocardioides nitrophenolicus]MBM7515591.1 transcriptional regulator with XRE-family HTH domain [Nocardioides nitrophenolicus]